MTAGRNAARRVHYGNISTLRFGHSMRSLQIALYADLVCPWCWIGDRRLFRAIEAIRATDPDVVIDVAWHPFQLDPTVPAEGRPWSDVVDAKFGGMERAREMFAHVATAGVADGILFDFDRITVAPNTVRAHALVLQRQQSSGSPWALIETLFRAYFEQGQDIGNVETLVRVAVEAGLDGDETRAAIERGRFDVDIMQSQREAARLGVRGVPFVVLDGRYGVSGAQPVEVFEQAIRRALSE